MLVIVHCNENLEHIAFFPYNNPTAFISRQIVLFFLAKYRNAALPTITRVQLKSNNLKFVQREVAAVYSVLFNNGIRSTKFTIDFMIIFANVTL